MSFGKLSFVKLCSLKLNKTHNAFYWITKPRHSLRGKMVVMPKRLSLLISSTSLPLRNVERSDDIFTTNPEARNR